MLRQKKLSVLALAAFSASLTAVSAFAAEPAVSAVPKAAAEVTAASFDENGFQKAEDGEMFLTKCMQTEDGKEMTVSVYTAGEHIDGKQSYTVKKGDNGVFYFETVEGYKVSFESK